MTYDNSIFNISALKFLIHQCFDIGFRRHFGGNHHVKLRKYIFSMPDIGLFDCSIDIVLTFKFGRHIVILKMAISDYVDYIKVEQALLIAAQILLNQ